MEIETLLRAYRLACNDAYAYNYHRVDKDSRLRRERQRDKIKKGIIRKFERLERENAKLRSELYAGGYPIRYECHYNPEDFGWLKISPFVFIKTDK